MMWSASVVAVVAVVVVAGTSALPPAVTPTPRFLARRQTHDPRLGDYVQTLGLDLSSVTWAARDNVVISPLSISAVLSMLLLGTAGSTYHELRTALLYGSVPDGVVHEAFGNTLRRLQNPGSGVQVNIANRLYVQQGTTVLLNFSAPAQQHYDISTRTLNFRHDNQRSLSTINAWVSQQTNGKIPNLLSTLNPQTTLMAVNTVYFNAAWDKPFSPTLTADANFQTPWGNKTLPTMRQMMEVPYINIPQLNAHMAALPYKGRRHALIFIVPKGPQVTLEALEDLELQLDALTLTQHINAMQPRFMNVWLPKMQLRYKTNIAEALKDLGVRSLFNAAQADFSPMTPSPVAVDRVAHETVIEVTETGTEAAAATSIELNRFGTSMVFAVDRPALLLIRELDSGMPLFYGRVVDPQPAA